jgi:hypothetical protein
MGIRLFFWVGRVLFYLSVLSLLGIFGFMYESMLFFHSWKDFWEHILFTAALLSPTGILGYAAAACFPAIFDAAARSIIAVTE